MQNGGGCLTRNCIIGAVYSAPTRCSLRCVIRSFHLQILRPENRRPFSVIVNRPKFTGRPSGVTISA